MFSRQLYVNAFLFSAVIFGILGSTEIMRQNKLFVRIVTSGGIFFPGLYSFASFL